MHRLLSIRDSIQKKNNWEEVYFFAQKQAITGLVFGEIEKGSAKIPGLPPQLLFQWIGVVELIKQQNQKVNRELVALAELLASNNISYAVVKGQVVAMYYERPELRNSGDIDFYCEPGSVERAKEVICNEWDVEIENGDSPYHYHFEHNGITFELHFHLFFFYQKYRILYWQNLLQKSLGYKVNIGNAQISTLEPSVHALYVFLHLYNHLTKVGVGLRQFYDLSVLLKANVDHSALRNYLRELGMVSAFRACEYILADCLGLDEKYLPYVIRPIDRRFGKRMLDVVLYRGNMGHYNKRNGWSGLGHQIESASIKLSHFVKFFWLSPGYHLGWMRERCKTVLVINK